MNKQNFLNIIKNRALAGDDDVQSFQKLAKQYPYSQMIHALLAKQQVEKKSSNAKDAIQLAAIYSTDRVVLKKIIESTPLQNVQSHTNATESDSNVESKAFTSAPSRISDIAQLRSDIFEHLALLQESKKPFYTDSGDAKTKKAKSTSTTKKNTKTAKKAKPSDKVKTQSEKKTSTSKKKKEEATSLSQKEQVDLIEKFIKSTPKIKKVNHTSDPDENQQDLSKIEATFEEDFASENLAQILSKQGNKEKAIEIYKKLIWKFPQKKAYFATQIEKLKK